jgi:6-phosphogluconolactonase (cycloisomerase 2 family)
MKGLLGFVAIMVSACCLSGCGSGYEDDAPPPQAASTYSIGFTIAGLSGSGLRIGIGTESLSVASDRFATFATRLPTGAGYDVIVLNQPSLPRQFCSVYNGQGAIQRSDVTNVVVNCVDNTVARAAYALNFAGESISIYSIDAASGQLRNRGYAKTGLGPSLLTHDRTGRFSFVLNSGIGPGTPSRVERSSISVFSRDDRTGDLREVKGSPFDTSLSVIGARGMTLHRSGRFVYVPADAGIFQWAVSEEGTLTAIGAGYVDAGRTPRELVFDDAGRFAYVTHNERESDGIYVFEMNATTGGLQERPSLRQAFENRDLRLSTLALHPNGKFLYAVNQPFEAVPGRMVAFSIDASTGALSPIPGQPFVLPVNSAAAPIFHPSGESLYVPAFPADSSTGQVAAFAVDRSTGALTPLSGSPHATGVGAGSVALAPSGKFLFVANQGSQGIGAGASISAFEIDRSTGSLTALPGVPNLQVAPFTARVDPSSRRLYVANLRSDLITAFDVDVNGALEPFMTIRAGNDPVLIEPFASSHIAAPTFAPRFAYVADTGSNSVASFSINGTSGEWSPTGTVLSDGTNVRAVAASGDGHLVYSIQSSGNVSAYTADPTSGTLMRVVGNAAPTGAGPVAVAVDPSHRFAYALNANDSTVTQYEIDAVTGGLQIQAAPTSTIAQPLSMAIDPNGRNLYVLSFSQLQAFTIDAGTGALRSPESIIKGVTDLLTDQATQMAIAPGGRFLYVVSPDRSIETYAIDPRTGLLGEVHAMTTERSAVAIDIDPTGRFMYASDWLSASISRFELHSQQGTPIPLGASAVPLDPSNVSVDTSGRFLYAPRVDGTLASFAIDAVRGGLTPIAGSRLAIGTPLALTTIVSVGEVR